MSKMNLPNKLTIFRVILIVPFIILLLGGQAGWFGDNTFVTDMIALAIFIIASLTDLIDGKIARKYNLITDFGKFMDPLADKLLVCSAMIALIEMNRIPSWVVIIIIAREFIISGFRLIASDSHRRKLLGQVQDHLPDGYDLSDDRQLPAVTDPHRYYYVDRTDPHRSISDRLSREEQRCYEGYEVNRKLREQ